MAIENDPTWGTDSSKFAVNSIRFEPRDEEKEILDQIKAKVDAKIGRLLKPGIEIMDKIDEKPLTPFSIEEYLHGLLRVIRHLELAQLDAQAEADIAHWHYDEIYYNAYAAASGTAEVRKSNVRGMTFEERSYFIVTQISYQMIKSHLQTLNRYVKTLMYSPSRTR